MEDRERIEERIRERTRAVVIIVLVAIAIIFGSWFGIIKPVKESAFKASIKEIQVRILHTERHYTTFRGYTEVVIINNEKEEKIKFDKTFYPGLQDWVKIEEDCVVIPEFIYGLDFYWIKYAGTGEIKHLLDIKLVGGKRELVEKMAAGDERPDIITWHQKRGGIYHSWRRDDETYAIIKDFSLFKEYGGPSVNCAAYFDTTKDKDRGNAFAYSGDITDKKVILKAFDLEYSIPLYGKKIIAHEVWILEDDGWNLYSLEKDDKREIHVSKENGKVKFELR